MFELLLKYSLSTFLICNIHSDGEPAIVYSNESESQRLAEHK